MRDESSGVLFYSSFIPHPSSFPLTLLSGICYTSCPWMGTSSRAEPFLRPPEDNDDHEDRSHYRHHGPGWQLFGGIAARTGLSCLRHGPPREYREFPAH